MKVFSMNQTANFQSPTQLFFGPGSIDKVNDIALSTGIHKALVISDPGVRANGIPDRVATLLAEQGVLNIIFDEVEPNPSIETIMHAYEVYKNHGCNGLIAVGGGSSIDVSKSVGILATNSGYLLDYIGIDKIKNQLPPMLAIPSTVGSGSEVTRFAVVMDRKKKKKMVIGSELISPRFAFLDPDITESLPSHLIASTGLDALIHAIESMLSNFATPFSDSLALEAIHLICTNLYIAYKLKEKAALANLLYASTMAGISFNNARTGLVHGMSHPLSSYHDVPHGLANAILLPYVLEFNMPNCVSTMSRIAVTMGESPDPEATIKAVRHLSTMVDIPMKLRDVGVTNDFIHDMAQDAYESGNARVVNPRTPTIQDIVDIYNHAL